MIWRLKSAEERREAAWLLGFSISLQFAACATLLLGVVGFVTERFGPVPAAWVSASSLVISRWSGITYERWRGEK
jgi:hypothetical protein